MERHKILAQNSKLNDLKNYPENIVLRWLLVIPLVLQTVGATALVGYLAAQSRQQIVEHLADQPLKQTSERGRDRLLQAAQQVVIANSLETRQGTLNVNQPEQLQQHLWQQMRLNSSLPVNGFWLEKESGISYGRVVTQEESDLTGWLTGQTLRTLLLGLAILGVTIPLGCLIAQRIAKPLHRLNRSAHRSAQNQFDQGVPVTMSGEVRQLSQVVQQMAAQLQLFFQLRTGYQRELEQQVAERTAELAHSRDLREAIFNESTDAIFLVESPPTTRIFDCNQRALELFEVASKAELVGIQAASLQKHSYTEAERAEVAAEIEQKGFWSGEIEYVTKTGKCFWGNLAVKPITVAGQAMQLVRLTDISDRKQLEFALQQSEVKTKNILDSTIAGIASMRVFEDGTWLIEQVSEGAESICGYSTEALTQDNQLWISLILAEDWEMLAPQIFTNIFAGAMFAYEYRLRHKDGRLRWISQTNNSFWNEEQRYWNVTAISVDITDRKQTELELQAKTQELDRFFSVALDLLCIADVDGYFRRLNQEWEKTLGYSLQELEGRRFLDFVHPDDIASTLDEMSLLANQKSSLNFVNRYRCRDGSYRWIEWRSFLVDKLVYAAARDITDRRQAELALRQSEQKFKGAFDTISVGMALVSPAGGFIEVNAALCRMLDYTEDELLKLRLEDIEHPGDRGVDASWLEPILSGAQPSHQAERRFLSKQGKTIWGLMNLAVMRNTQAAPLYLIVQIADLSDRHHLDTMKDEFISIVSHELRTPLTAIRGSLGILKAGILSDEPETAQQMLDVALRSTDRLVRLVNDILNLERLESGKAILKKESCEISDLMAQAVESVQAIADQAQISIEWTAIAASVDVAPDAIVQTLTNLLSNAIKFSPMGGSVRLKAEISDAFSLPISKQLLQRQAPSYPTYVLVSIADQGRGIPPEKLESIFGRFQQVDSSDSRQKGGTGLGLAICRSIVQQHEGHIWVESTLGKGSTFYFMLPIQGN